MSDSQTNPMTLKNVLVLILVAIVMSVVVTLLQTLILGKSNVAITGAIVGASVVGLWMQTKRKSS